MGGVTVREYGLSFVRVCLQKYIGKSWPFLLIFLAGIAVSILLSVRGKRRDNPLEVVTVDGNDRNMNYGEPDYEEDENGGSTAKMFLSVFLICAVTVCNPFLVRALIPKLGMTAVYYRFFWVIPITFGAAYYLTAALIRVRNRVLRILAALAAAVALACIIPVNPGLLNLKLPTNVYKVDGAVPVLCEAIHADFETTAAYRKALKRSEANIDRNSEKWLRWQAGQYPLCVFPSQIEFAVRQYDPTIRLLFNRNLRLYYEGNRTTGITYDETKVRYQRRALILDAMYGRDESITTESFQEAMEKTRTKYLVVEENLANGGFLTGAGCTQVGVTAGYTIFRYGD